MNTKIDPLNYYSTHGLMTDPGEQAPLFSDLPDDIPALCKVVQGLLVHEGWAKQYGISVPKERELESGIRSVAGKLNRIRELDDHPLTETRPAADRLLCICRDFALLLTAMLRHKGIPARVRFGFANYFQPPEAKDNYGDHVITEYWRAQDQKWILVDAELDELHCNIIGATFDPCNISRDTFLTADVAWKQCQAGEKNPAQFGMFQYTGLWYVKGHLARDFAALNKVEMLCWDYWGLFERRDADLPADDLELLDRAAALSLAGNEAFDELRALYLQDMRLRVPPVVKSWYVDNEEEYRLEEILKQNLSLAKYL